MVDLSDLTGEKGFKFMSKKHIAHDIRWDTDGDMKLFKTLPQEIEIPDEVWEDYDNGNDDALSDYVSNVTGFCHYGFEVRIEKIKEEKIMTNINNIDRDNHMYNFTVFKYGADIDDIVDQFSTQDIDEAIAMAEADEYDEVVNDDTGEIVWKKGGKIMINTNTNISIYDRIELGDTFHNNNGTDYTILAFDKDADIAILLNPKNKFTPYVGAYGLRNDCWNSGHYFKTLNNACEWYNSIIDGTY